MFGCFLCRTFYGCFSRNEFIICIFCGNFIRINLILCCIRSKILGELIVCHCGTKYSGPTE